MPYILICYKPRSGSLTNMSEVIFVKFLSLEEAFTFDFTMYFFSEILTYSSFSSLSSSIIYDFIFFVGISFTVFLNPFSFGSSEDILICSEGELLSFICILKGFTDPGYK